MPAAVHTVTVGHDTAVRLLLVAPAGNAGRWIDHRFPFQRSTSISPPPVSRCTVPTAVQALHDAHDTAARLPALAPVSLAVRRFDQLAPSHDHAALPFPTAMHAVRDGHETPVKVPPPRLGWIDQLEPFQRSTKTKGPPEYGPVWDPTAVHAVGPEHDTLIRPVLSATIGVGAD